MARSVCIIGAGLGGLTLARCLKHRGIPAIVYDRSASSPRHSYGITLHEATYRPLLSVLDLDIDTFRGSLSVDARIAGNGNIDPSHLVQPGNVTSTSFRANRQKLELLLRDGLDVRWEHQLDRIEQMPDSITNLFMSNGRCIEASHVIAADGPHSRARMALMPKVPLRILPIVAINGKRRVTRQDFDNGYLPYLRDCNVIELRREGVILNISLSDVTDEVVYLSWIFSRSAKPSGDALFNPDRSNAGASDIPQAFYHEISQFRHLERPFSDVFDPEQLKQDRKLSWLMRTTDVPLVDLNTAAARGVFFIGDAVHAQPILGGEGANEAITDGVELARLIAENGL
ncbi:hypothetical protein CAC42_5 [Sphaceloma murrayae]|uniref:FAD-binding domain-containing protein n=1 Tax=Sphaceloma murrayae TaxID=2082308 RepID=A0A2K1QS10_9PEZI|nr:hypothetical protein CAC42_5 [Sphaceloma murrayae]